MRPKTHIAITYLAGKSMGLNEQQLQQLTNDVLKPDFIDLPFVFPKHYYESGRWNDATKKIKDTDNMGYKIHYLEDVGNPYHTTFLYLGRHFNYENIVDDNWDNWNLNYDVINAPIENDCISSKTGVYCDKVAITKLGKESSDMFNILDNAMLNEDGSELKKITKYMIGRTSSYVKGLMRNYYG